MVNENAIVTWMDLNQKDVINDTIGNMTQYYSDKMDAIQGIPLVGSMGSIIFTQVENIKITDLYGWTDLVELSKKPIQGESYWMEIKAGENTIIVDSFTLIPVYLTDNPTVGYHGEVKYDYVLKHPEKILPTDKIRIKRGMTDMEFVTPVIKRSNYDGKFGYEIMTKSRFANMENVYMFASDMLKVNPDNPDYLY